MSVVAGGSPRPRRAGPRRGLARFGKYVALTRAQVAHGLAYPLDLLGRGLSIVVFMWVFLHLWRTTFASRGATVIDGLTLHDTLWYLVVAETIVLSRPRLSRAVASSVRDGSIAHQLSKPVSYLGYQFAVGLGDAAVRAVPTAALGAAVVWLTLGPPQPTLLWPLALVAVLLAWLLDFCMAAMIGLAAFFTEDVSAFEWIYSKIQLILGGVLIPLDFLPDLLRTIATSLPFAYTVWAPSRLFVSRDATGALRLLGAQAAWLLVLALVLALAWRKAAARLVINGG